MGTTNSSVSFFPKKGTPEYDEADKRLTAGAVRYGRQGDAATRKLGQSDVGWTRCRHPAIWLRRPCRDWHEMGLRTVAGKLAQS